MSGWKGSSRKWRVIRAAVLARDNYQCQIQGPNCLGTATQPDHIVPKSQGGSDMMSNLRAACQPCNSARSDKPVDPAPLGRW